MRLHEKELVQLEKEGMTASRIGCWAKAES
jgi:hypothetical protein